MSHQIEYLEFNENRTKKEILSRINEFAYDPQESDHYHGNLTFHEFIVYDNYEKAIEAIESFDNGWYSDHAVKYYETIQNNNSEQTKEKRIMWLVKVEWHC